MCHEMGQSFLINPCCLEYVSQRIYVVSNFRVPFLFCHCICGGNELICYVKF